jgi:hypothetical protein
MRHNTGTARHQKSLVWCGDSITKGGTAPSSSFERAGDLVARSMACRGVARFNSGYFTDASSAYRRWDRATGAVSSESTLNSGSYSRAQLKANVAALASSCDVVYHNVCTGGRTAGSLQSPAGGFDTYGPPWVGDVEESTIGTGYVDPVDFLVVQFAHNDIAWGDTAEMFRDNLIARLDAWTNVRRKFIFLSWAESSYDFPQEASDIWDWFHDDVNGFGAVSAAALATPGDRQSGIPVVTASRWQGMLAWPTTADGQLSNDGIHLTTTGAAFMAQRWREYASGDAVGDQLGAMRP